MISLWAVPLRLFPQHTLDLLDISDFLDLLRTAMNKPIDLAVLFNAFNLLLLFQYYFHQLSVVTCTRDEMLSCLGGKKSGGRGNEVKPPGREKVSCTLEATPQR